jgi:hypothetical protein
MQLALFDERASASPLLATVPQGFLGPHLRIPRRQADAHGHFALRCGTCAAWVAARDREGWCNNPRCGSHYLRAADALISGIHCPWHRGVTETQNCGSAIDAESHN